MVAADSYTDSTVQAGLTYYYVVTSVTSSRRAERGFHADLGHHPNPLVFRAPGAGGHGPGRDCDRRIDHGDFWNGPGYALGNLEICVTRST